MPVFVETLFGSMINPLVIVMVFVAYFFLRTRPVWMQFGVAMAAVLVAFIVFQAFDDTQPSADKVSEIVYGLLAAAIWFGIFSGERFLRRR
jgi:hypothetical protein